MNYLKLTSILLLIFLASCLSPEERAEKHRIKTFEKHLGSSESNALNIRVEALEKFLERSFPEEEIGEAYISYLSLVKDWQIDEIRLDYYWIDSARVGKFTRESGLDKELWRYRYDEENEKYVEFNQYGKFIEALDLIKGQDSTLIGYVDFKLEMGNMHPSICANSMMHTRILIDDYFIKRIIAVELFYR